MTEEPDLAATAEPRFRMRVRIKEKPQPAQQAEPALAAPVATEASRYGLTEPRAKELRQLARAVAAVLSPEEARYLGRVLVGGKAEADAVPKRGRGRPRKVIT